MKQSRIESLVEAVCNTLLGLGVSMVANTIIIPAVLGVPLTLAGNIKLAFFFTIVSIARGYAVRRFFNAGFHRAAVAIAARFAR